MALKNRSSPRLVKARALAMIEEIDRRKAQNAHADAQVRTKTDEYGGAEQIASMVHARVPVKEAENKQKCRKSAVAAALRLKEVYKTRPTGTTRQAALAAAPDINFDNQRQVNICSRVLLIFVYRYNIPTCSDHCIATLS